MNPAFWIRQKFWLAGINLDAYGAGPSVAVAERDPTSSTLCFKHVESLDRSWAGKVGVLLSWLTEMSAPVSLPIIACEKERKDTLSHPSDGHRVRSLVTRWTSRVAGGLYPLPSACASERAVTLRDKPLMTLESESALRAISKDRGGGSKTKGRHGARARDSLSPLAMIAPHAPNLAGKCLEGSTQRLKIRGAKWAFCVL